VALTITDVLNVLQEKFINFLYVCTSHLACSVIELGPNPRTVNFIHTRGHPLEGEGDSSSQGLYQHKHLYKHPWGHSMDSNPQQKHTRCPGFIHWHVHNHTCRMWVGVTWSSQQAVVFGTERLHGLEKTGQPRNQLERLQFLRTYLCKISIKCTHNGEASVSISVTNY